MKLPMREATCPKLRRHEMHLLRGWLALPAGHGDALTEGEPPAATLARLRERELWPQAMRFIAYSLPERETVWWSCMCVRHTAGELGGAERRAIEAAESWVHRPDPESGRDVDLALRAAAFAVPGAWCGLAAVWAERGSSRSDLRAGRASAKAVEQAAERDRADPARRRRRHIEFYTSGVDIAEGGAGRLLAERGGGAREAAACPSS